MQKHLLIYIGFERRQIGLIGFQAIRFYDFIVSSRIGPR